MAQSSTAASTTPDLQDRPVLASATWLVGRLQESALENPPWAVEQPKRGYVELSELAYHVAEQANGEQTTDEIATAVSTALRRPVSAMDVEALIDTVLIPRGVIRDPDGQVYQDDDLAAEAAPEAAEPPVRPVPRNGRGRPGRPVPGRPPRRERIVGPERLETVASILMWLFWPPVMLAVATAALAALIWLFTIHGLAWSVIQVLAAPMLLPIALLVTVLGAAVQGIGPMVALYSGGATIQRLRISPGLTRPRFVVDVADDYGLSRWARLVVNVSGVYLQLVVVLVLCVLGWAFGAEWLLLSAALLTLNILRLLLPFGRPGADRLLADWLLVQHPLRYAGHALNRYVTGLAVAPRPLPPLKRWGRVTIGVSLVAVAVVLTIVWLVILRTMPTIAATVWVALTAHLFGMTGALGERDVVTFLGSMFNAAILALTTFCLVVALVVAAYRVLARAWAWGQETPRRRLLAIIGAALLALLLVVSWVPVRGWGGNGAPRSLVGIPFRSLNELSRGTMADLFGETPSNEAPIDQSGERTMVTTDVGSGPVEGPPPGQATPATGAAPAAGDTGTGGAATTAGTPAAKPGQIGAETPGPAGAERGTPGVAGQDANAPAGPATAVPGNAPAGQSTAGPAAAPAARGTADAAEPPAAQATADSGPGPAVQATSGPNAEPGAAEKPAAKPTGGVVVQPVNKPTTGTAGQPSTKPSTGAAGQPASKPAVQATRGPTSAQDDEDEEEPDDALDVTPGPAQP